MTTLPDVFFECLNEQFGDIRFPFSFGSRPTKRAAAGPVEKGNLLIFPTLPNPTSSKPPPYRLDLSLLLVNPNLPTRQRTVQYAPFVDQDAVAHLNSTVFNPLNMNTRVVLKDSKQLFSAKELVTPDEQQLLDQLETNAARELWFIQNDRTLRERASARHYDRVENEPHVLFYCPFRLLKTPRHDATPLSAHPDATEDQDPDALPYADEDYEIRALPVLMPNLPEHILGDSHFVNDRVYIALWCAPASMSHARVRGWLRMSPKGRQRYEMRTYADFSHAPKPELRVEKDAESNSARLARFRSRLTWTPATPGARLLALARANVRHIYVDPLESTPRMEKSFRLLDRRREWKKVYEELGEDGPTPSNTEAFEIVEAFTHLLMRPALITPTTRPTPLPPPSFEYDPESGMIGIVELPAEASTYFMRYDLDMPVKGMSAQQRRRLEKHARRPTSLADTHMIVMSSGAVRIVPSTRHLSLICPAGFTPDSCGLRARRLRAIASPQTLQYEIEIDEEREPLLMGPKSVAATTLPSASRDYFPAGKYVLTEPPGLVLPLTPLPTANRPRSMVLTFVHTATTETVPITERVPDGEYVTLDD